MSRTGWPIRVSFSTFKHLSVIAFLSFPSVYYKDNDITGDVLVHADHEMLRELDVSSVGTRFAILKAVYTAKMHFGIPVEEGDYVPSGTYHILGKRLMQ